jgi:ubiquinone/menaquinone biosynthesis C-methylase UbiE
MTNSSWDNYLMNIRSQEINIAFKNFEAKNFKQGLELGAGNGFQSTLLVNFCDQLVATELNEARLLKRKIPNVEYIICDAEKIDTYFEEKKFDLVFSSNMFEHLSDPENALFGIQKILKDDGMVILLMPSVFWKFCHLFLYYPVKIVNTIKRKLFKEKTYSKEVGTNSNDDTSDNLGNNLKEKPYQRSYFLDLILWPVPHGVSKSNLEEFSKFKKSNWINMFNRCGFKIIDIKRGPITSGYGLHFNRIRKFLWYLGFTSEYIYFLKK